MLPELNKQKINGLPNDDNMKILADKLQKGIDDYENGRMNDFGDAFKKIRKELNITE